MVNRCFRPRSHQSIPGICVRRSVVDATQPFCLRWKALPQFYLAMDINELLRPLKDGTAANLSVEELSQRSQRCVWFILNRYPEGDLAKDAYDAEIRRKE